MQNYFFLEQVGESHSVTRYLVLSSEDFVFQKEKKKRDFFFLQIQTRY